MATHNPPPDDLPEAARRVERALKAAGIAAAIVQLPGSTRTAVEAAAAVGCRVEQIAKSIVFGRVDSGAPVLVIASGPNRVDEQVASAHVGAAIGKAGADYVRSRTGFAIGGVPPIGHAQAIETLVDRDLVDLDRVWAAAGTPHAVFAIDPRELVRATGARVVALAARKQRT